MSLYLQIYKEKNVDKMQDMFNNMQKLTNQVEFQYLCSHFCSLFFCIFIMLAAQFDLKLTQYDTVNVFMHANLNEIIFMKMSDKY